MFERKSSSSRRKRRTGRWVFLCLFILLILWVPLEFYLSNNLPKLQKTDLKLEALPPAFEGFKILHLSDLHEKFFGKDNRDMLALCEKADPDIIVITGDLYQSADGLSYIETLFPPLLELAPVYYVTGNHEWGAEWTANRENAPSIIDRANELFDRLGVVVMDAKILPIERNGETILLAGLCDPNGPAGSLTAAGLSRQIKQEYGELFTVVLSHRFDMLSEYAAAGFDLVLTGHAHGGVVRLPFTDGLIGPGGRQFFPEHTAGLYIEDETAMYVSRGLGDTEFPRFLNRPDLSLLTLHTGGEEE